MTEPYCAVCRRHVDPGETHVRVDATTKRANDRDDQEEYYVHERCWRSISDGWMDSA